MYAQADVLNVLHCGVLPTPACVHFRRRSFHIPCYGAHQNISSWDWWFHVFTVSYLKTMNEFYMDEDVGTEMFCHGYGPTAAITLGSF